MEKLPGLGVGVGHTGDGVQAGRGVIVGHAGGGVGTGQAGEGVQAGRGVMVGHAGGGVGIGQAGTGVMVGQEGGGVGIGQAGPGVKVGQLLRDKEDGDRGLKVIVVDFVQFFWASRNLSFEFLLIIKIPILNDIIIRKRTTINQK